MNDDRVEALIQAAVLLHDKDYALAEKIINEKYPFTPVKSSGRNYTVKQMVTQFFSDGFIDRYSGKRLVNPGILRGMSEILPKVFHIRHMGKQMNAIWPIGISNPQLIIFIQFR